MKRKFKIFKRYIGGPYRISIVLFPSVEYTYLPTGNFIEQGVYSWKHKIEVKFLFWGIGLAYFLDFDEYYEDEVKKELGSDEPLEYSAQITSIPEKQIGDE